MLLLTIFIGLILAFLFGPKIFIYWIIFSDVLFTASTISDLVNDLDTGLPTLWLIVHGFFAIAAVIIFMYNPPNSNENPRDCK